MFRFTKKYKTTWMLPKSETGTYLTTAEYVPATIKMLPLPEPREVLSAGEITD